jgi:hypothetical protein
MKKHSLQFFLFFLLLFVNTIVKANSAVIQQQADEKLTQIYAQLKNKNFTLTQRLTWISENFLNNPYLLTALGEGPDAKYDQFPWYRTDAFDCLTYVETVLAAALGHDIASFKQNLLKIRYKAAKPAYLNRNHFTDLDWNINNQQQGLVKDITLQIQDAHHQPIARVATAEINKPAWYAKRSLNTIRLENGNHLESQKRLDALKQKGQALPIAKVSLPYLPLKTLFKKNGEPELFYFAQIPEAAIIEIVRPNWDLQKEIGTHLNISHLGFAIWKNGTLYFRHASTKQHTLDIPLISYLQQALSSPTIQGIHLQKAIPQ